MDTALKHNTDHIHLLCDRLGIGQPCAAPAPVRGGFHHRMWRLDTSAGTYAVKQLADDMDMHDATTARRLDATEQVARAFAERGIPALASLHCGDRHLQVIDDSGYFVYPWTERRARRRKQISEYHSVTVARILARMHAIDLSIDGLGRPVTWPLTAERVVELLSLAKQRNARDINYLLEREADILAVVEMQAPAHAVLAAGRTVSHGDLDHKNVLWNEAGEPLLIDWESARAINPTYELLLEALDWSGITANFETGPFRCFLEAYVEAGGEIRVDMIPAAFDAILGAWVNWALYNVGRAVGVEDLRQRAIGSDQIDLAVGALLRLERNIPRLRDIARACAN